MTTPTIMRHTGVRAHRPARKRALRWGAIVGALTTLGVFALAGVLVGGSSHEPSLSAQRAQLAHWEADVHPLILSAGQVVALGPRQGVAQLQGNQFSAATNEHMAAGWVARLTQLRAQLKSVKAPGFLADARSLLDRSLAEYIAASQDLLAASTATGPQRTSLVNDADVAGRAADRLYDQATAAIAARRAHVGLPVDWSGSS